MVLDTKILSLINQIGNDQMETLSTGGFLVINALYHEECITENLRPCLRRLTELGIVEHVGCSKHVFARSLYMATGKSGLHTRIVGLDRDTYKELLLKHICQKKHKCCEVACDKCFVVSWEETCC